MEHSQEELRRVYKEGYDAYYDDVSKSSNPYSIEYEEDMHEAWLDGYLQGWWED